MLETKWGERRGAEAPGSGPGWEAARRETAEAGWAMTAPEAGPRLRNRLALLLPFSLRDSCPGACWEEPQVKDKKRP